MGGLVFLKRVCYDSNMKVSIAIPIYHSSDILFDFTKQTLESIQSSEHELHIILINNYSLPEFYPMQDKFNLHESIKSFTVIDNPKGNHVPSAWNLGIKMGLEAEATSNVAAADYVAVLNNDLILHSKCIDNLIKFANAHQEFILWSASEWLDQKTLLEAQLEDVFSEHPHFSFFMVNQKTIDMVGWIDENLKMAYMEDGDMHYRIILSGNKAGKTESAKFYHYGSRTIKVDEDLYDQNKRTYEDNRAYIWQKWHIDFHGKVFVPPEEMLKVGYQHPFNNSDKDWRNW